MTYRNRNSFLALLLCACLIALTLLSALFLVSHAGHNCTHTVCAVCTQLQMAAHVLKQLGGAVPALWRAVLAILCAAGLAAASRSVPPPSPSPVLLKVKQNN